MTERDYLLDALSLVWQDASVGTFESQLSLWRYSKHFEELWGVLRGPSVPWQEGARAVVVWDDLPATVFSELNVGQHLLSPISWALCLSQSTPPISVWILDLAPGQRERRPLYQHMRELPRLSDGHLRIITPNGWLTSWNDLRRGPRAAPRERGLAVDLLFSQLRREMGSTADFDRHHVSNVLGALRLLQALGGTRSQRAMGRHALLTLVECAEGLLPSSDRVLTERPAVRSLEVAKQRLREMEPVEVVLVDDQHRNGWGEFVCRAVGAQFRAAPGSTPVRIDDGSTPGVSVLAADDPEFLVELLADTFRESRTRGGDRRFALQLHKDQEGAPILLLDLRLFAGRRAKDELAYFGQLLGLAEMLSTRGDALGWQTFDDEELRGIRRWLDCFDENDLPGWRKRTEYLDAIALLPRLLALADFSLPIVLFSSTGQRRIVERVSRYGNVITDFEKPRFLGYAEADSSTRAIASFGDALVRACSLLEARHLCTELLQCARENPIPRRRRAKSARHFELYVDESGSASMAGDPDAANPEKQRFVVAGLLVGYPSAVDRGPEELHHRLAEAGLRWWPENLQSPFILKGSRLEDGDLPGALVPADEVLERFSECAKGWHFSGVCLEYEERAPREPTGDFRAEWRDDNRYRLTLSTLLEIVLYDLLPAIKEAEPADVSVFVATRARGHDEFRGGRASIQRLRELYGYVGDRDHLRSITEASVLPLLVDALNRRPGAVLQLEIEHARGVRLVYPKFKMIDDLQYPAVRLNRDGRPIVVDGEPPWSKTRHQHYVADIVARRCRELRGNISRCEPMKRMFEAGSYDVLDADFEAVLGATRGMAGDDRARAFAELSRLDWRRIRWGQRSVALLLIHRLAAALREELTGEWFRALAEELRQMCPLVPGEEDTAERGFVKFADLDRRYGFIRSDEGKGDCHFRLRAWRSATHPLPGEAVEFVRGLDDRGGTTAVWVRSLA